MIEKFTTRIIAKTKLADDIFHFSFSLTSPKSIHFTPGQYVLLHIPRDFITRLLRQNPSLRLSPRDTGDNDAIRQYSICSPDFTQDTFDLLVEVLPGGLASNYLSTLAVGDTVEFKGPAGIFTIQSKWKDKIFLATGTGIAPIRSMLMSALENQSPVVGDQSISEKHIDNQQPKYHLFWGLRYGKEVYFFDDFKRMIAIYPNFSFRICLSQEAQIGNLDAKCFGSGRVDKNLIQLLETVTGDMPATKQHRQQSQELTKLYNSFEYYICGAQVIVESLRQFVLSLGVEKENIFFEKFV